MSEILQNEESIKLYEYESYKPDIEDYISHHGILGMKWGKKNGPPYPLSSKVSTGSRLKKGAKGSGGEYGGNPDGSKKKTLGQKLKEHKVAKKRKKSLEKARQTKAANVEKRKADAAEKERISKMREEAIKKNDIVTMYKNSDHFSRSEIEEALNRKGTLDRLANEIAKTQPAPKKSKLASAASSGVDSVKKGVSSGFKSTLSNVAENAFKMGMQELVTRAAGGTKTEFSKLTPEQKAMLVARLFKEKKK